MKKPKVVIGIFVGLVLIVLTIVLLACTVFVVRHVEVEFEVSSNLLNEESILDASGLSVGSSIISIDKSEVKASVEKENPYVEVTNISREFPNKVIIKVTVRRGILLVRSEDGGSAAVIDAKMKVLDVIPYSESMKSDVTAVEGVTFVVPQEGVLSLVGSEISFANPVCGAMLSQITTAASDPKLMLSGNRFLTFIKEISFTTEEGSCKAFVKTKRGVTLVLDTALDSTVFTQLYMCLYYMYAEGVSVDVTSGFIYWDPTPGAYRWATTLD